MNEYNFRVTTIETGWVEIHARDAEEAKLKLKAQCPDINDLTDDWKWREGKVTKVELQKSNGDEDITNIYESR